MQSGKPLVPHRDSLAFVDADTEPTPGDPRALATRDHEVIRRWADRHGAVPATGERTASGDRTTASVNDGDAGIRFNFPGFAPFRPIVWEEWFENFDRHSLTFVYEQDAADGARRHTYRLVPPDAIGDPPAAEVVRPRG